ncbi:MAG: hypothetical protein M3Q13_08635 [Pseudomonadota bacterium]|nr:hypothetical protein [Pseudomonadota bacterium]
MTTDTYNAGAQRGNRWRPLIWGGAAGLLLLPAIAMQFDNTEVNWTAGDFIVMGIVLAIACGIYELGAWLSGNTAYRAGFGIATLTGFLTIWVNLAVGMLGEGAVNLMFAGVLFVAAIGAILGNFRARGMARAMFATALAQLAAAGAGLAMGYEPLEVSLTACFALPWLLSGALFQKAAQDAATGASRT